MTSPWRLLRDQRGYYRNSDGQRCRIAGDDCMWLQQGSELRSSRGETLTLADAGRLEVEGESFAVETGPTRLPSEHLAELRETGLTVLENLLDDDACERIKRTGGQVLERYPPDTERSDGRVGVRFALAWSADVARAVTHPVAHWLMQSYLGTDDIHFCHPPGVTVMRPAAETLGTFPEDGWHSDYPYHPGIFPDDRWPTDRIFGVQFNICVDAFRPDNAATQYVPGSHGGTRWPPAEFNEGGTRMGVGVHRDVKQMLAPAGAALIYDARTWHRACDELNVSGKNRFAILNAVAPAWVVPMTDKSRGLRAYLDSDVPSRISPRERADIERLCHRELSPAPAGAPALTPRDTG